MVRTRYTSLAIVLHWTMAIALTVMVGSGIAMTRIDLDPSFQFDLYQWHKGGGVLLLLAVVVRLVTRWLSSAPPLPQTMKPLEQRAAKAGHYALYAMMVLMPLSGWVAVSASGFGLPTIVFGWFEWPHITVLFDNKPVANAAEWVHFLLAITLCALVVGHIGAVIKHAFVDHDNLLWRMWWKKADK